MIPISEEVPQVTAMSQLHTFYIHTHIYVYMSGVNRRIIGKEDQDPSTFQSSVFLEE